jgi:hypothetical protein
MVKLAIGLAILTALGFAGYSISEQDSDLMQTRALQSDESLGAPAGPRDETQTDPLLRYRGDVIGQTLGTVCSTPRGECTVPQAPINSYCTCGGTPGTIVR